MNKQDQQDKEFEEFYYSDEHDLTMPPDYFEPKLKDEIVSAEEMLEDGINDGRYADILDVMNPDMSNPMLQAVIRFAEDYADQFKKK